jgi:MarR family 2-MHQ and catechol resistance regulon transcriptional repressor
MFDVKLICVEKLQVIEPTGETAPQSHQRALDAYVKLSRAADAVHNRVNAHLQQHDLTTSQFGVLEAIYHLGPLQIGELGAKILKSSGNMTLVIDNLIKRELVYRERLVDDRRCIQIHLTAKGQALVEQLWGDHAQGVVEAFAVLTPAEQAQLAALCRKLGLAQG